MISPNEVREFRAQDLCDPEVRATLLALPHHLEICLLYEGNEADFQSEFLAALPGRFKKVYFTLILTRRVRLETFCAQAPPWLLAELHVLPVPFAARRCETLTCRETQRMLASLTKKGISGKVLPYRDFAHAAPGKAVEVKWLSQVSEKPALSILIPTRNYENFLINVLRHLFEQGLARERYEVIVIDDGGSDSSFAKAKLLLGPLGGQINFKYLYCDRRAGTEKHFRAGHCRNEGLTHSTGEWVLFLDSDMLLPPDFLENLLALDSQADVIQCPRWHIKPERSSQDTRIAKLSAHDIYIEEPKYWGPFFQSQDWSRIPAGWRYTCTYCLAVRRSALRQVGGFRQVFNSYGFEDTELGYRLHRGGFRFKLWSQKVWHLTPPRDKSRYYHSIMNKQILLAVTGKTFFLSTLDLDIYNMFEIYMGGESRWRQKFYHWAQRGKSSVRKNMVFKSGPPH